MRYNGPAFCYLNMISLMPGPVEIDPKIRTAFHQEPLSHRGSEFVCRFEGVRKALTEMTGAPHIGLFTGSGTLANEAVASCLEGPGLVLINGEFGARLAKQARRWGLAVRSLDWAWGDAWDFEQIEPALEGVDWVWATHLETSTGMLNDIRRLTDLANARNVKVCLDCISSVGAAEVDLKGVWLASGVSGKALGSYAGVAIVFAAEVPQLSREVPAYLDVAEAIRTEGPCFTFPSPLLLALEEALKKNRTHESLGGLVRENLRDKGIQPMVDGPLAAPIVTTFVPPSEDFTDRCLDLGFRIGGESGYLAQRGYVQIATMGAVTKNHIQELFAGL
jgi:aspartate aminotransferase-like enzyme